MLNFRFTRPTPSSQAPSPRPLHPPTTFRTKLGWWKVGLSELEYSVYNSYTCKGADLLWRNLFNKTFKRDTNVTPGDVMCKFLTTPRAVAGLARGECSYLPYGYDWRYLDVGNFARCNLLSCPTCYCGRVARAIKAVIRGARRLNRAKIDYAVVVHDVDMLSRQLLRVGTKGRKNKYNHEWVKLAKEGALGAVRGVCSHVVDGNTQWRTQTIVFVDKKRVSTNVFWKRPKQFHVQNDKYKSLTNLTTLVCNLWRYDPRFLQDDTLCLDLDRKKGVRKDYKRRLFAAHGLCRLSRIGKSSVYESGRHVIHSAPVDDFVRADDDEVAS